MTDSDEILLSIDFVDPSWIEKIDIAALFPNDASTNSITPDETGGLDSN